MKWTEATTTNTGNLDDFDFSGADLLRCNNASLLTIRGLRAGVGGQVLTIVSVGAGQVDLSHQDTGDGTAENRIICVATSGKTSLAAAVGSATLQYDATTARWRLIEHQQGAWITPAFSASDYTGNGAMTWTVDSGDVNVQYCLSGRTLHVVLQLSTTTVGGTLNNTLQRTIPGGFTAAIASNAVVSIADNANWRASLAGPYGSLILFYAHLAGPIQNWLASTNQTFIYATMTIGVS